MRPEFFDVQEAMGDITCAFDGIYDDDSIMPLGN